MNPKSTGSSVTEKNRRVKKLDLKFVNEKNYDIILNFKKFRHNNIKDVSSAGEIFNFKILDKQKLGITDRNLTSNTGSSEWKVKTENTNSKSFRGTLSESYNNNNIKNDPFLRYQIQENKEKDKKNENDLIKNKPYSTTQKDFYNKNTFNSGNCGIRGLKEEEIGKTYENEQNLTKEFKEGHSTICSANIISNRDYNSNFSISDLNKNTLETVIKNSKYNNFKKFNNIKSFNNLNLESILIPDSKIIDSIDNFITLESKNSQFDAAVPLTQRMENTEKSILEKYSMSNSFRRKYSNTNLGNIENKKYQNSKIASATEERYSIIDLDLYYENLKSVSLLNKSSIHKGLLQSYKETNYEVLETPFRSINKTENEFEIPEIDEDKGIFSIKKKLTRIPSISKSIKSLNIYKYIRAQSNHGKKTTKIAAKLLNTKSFYESPPEIHEIKVNKLHHYNSNLCEENKSIFKLKFSPDSVIKNKAKKVVTFNENLNDINYNDEDVVKKEKLIRSRSSFQRRSSFIGIDINSGLGSPDLSNTMSNEEDSCKFENDIFKLIPVATENDEFKIVDSVVRESNTNLNWISNSNKVPLDKLPILTILKKRNQPETSPEMKVVRKSNIVNTERLDLKGNLDDTLNNKINKNQLKKIYETESESKLKPSNLKFIKMKFHKIMNSLSLNSNQDLPNTINCETDKTNTVYNLSNLTQRDKRIIINIKLINKFLDSQNKLNFQSNIPKYRKIFVIIDSCTILNPSRIPGKYLDIPTKKHLMNKPDKKERLELFINFLKKVAIEILNDKSYKYIYTINGNIISDLVDIPDNDKALFVSIKQNFTGLNIYSDRSIDKIITQDDLKLLEFSKVDRKTIFRRRFRFHKRKLKLQWSNTENYNLFKKINVRKVKEIYTKNDHSFTHGYKFGRDIYSIVNQNTYSFKEDCYNKFDSFLEKLKLSNDHNNRPSINLNYKEFYDYSYYSDNENNTKHAQEVLKNYDKYDLFHYFNLFSLKMQKIDIRKKQNKLKKKYRINKPNEKSRQGLIQLINQYNKKRAKNNMINIKKEDNDNDDYNETNKLMIKYMEKLIFKRTNTADLDELALSLEVEKTSDKFINKNKKLVENIYFQINDGVEKFYPDLISFNIPQILKSYPTLSRKVLYEIFAQYKALMKVCVALNKSIKILKKGMDFQTFYSAVPGIHMNGVELAKKIFRTINDRHNNHLTWEEFMKGMIQLKSDNLSDKIQLFFKLIDSTGNKRLTYEEILDLSIASLGRSLGDVDSNNEVIRELGSYLASSIFTLLNKSENSMVSLNNVKEIILQHGKDYPYLEMFACSTD